MSPFSAKGLIVGAALSLLVGISAPYTMLVVQGSFMAKNSSEPGAIFLFFILVFIINVAVGFLNRRFALSKADLILKYGGAGLYYKLKPLFLGLILGEATVAGTWLFIDWLTGMRGNLISPM